MRIVIGAGLLFLTFTALLTDNYTIVGNTVELDDAAVRQCFIDEQLTLGTMILRKVSPSQSMYQWVWFTDKFPGNMYGVLFYLADTFSRGVICPADELYHPEDQLLN